MAVCLTEESLYSQFLELKKLDGPTSNTDLLETFKKNLCQVFGTVQRNMEFWDVFRNDIDDLFKIARWPTTSANKARDDELDSRMVAKYMYYRYMQMVQLENPEKENAYLLELGLLYLKYNETQSWFSAFLKDVFTGPQYKALQESLNKPRCPPLGQTVSLMTKYDKEVRQKPNEAVLCLYKKFQDLKKCARDVYVLEFVLQVHCLLANNPEAQLMFKMTFMRDKTEIADLRNIFNRSSMLINPVIVNDLNVFLYDNEQLLTPDERPTTIQYLTGAAVWTGLLLYAPIVIALPIAGYVYNNSRYDTTWRKYIV